VIWRLLAYPCTTCRADWTSPRPADPLPLLKKKGSTLTHPVKAKKKKERKNSRCRTLPRCLRLLGPLLPRLQRKRMPCRPYISPPCRFLLPLWQRAPMRLSWRRCLGRGWAHGSSATRRPASSSSPSSTMDLAVIL
jgi:hypothetical protein